MWYIIAASLVASINPMGVTPLMHTSLCCLCECSPMVLSLRRLRWMTTGKTVVFSYGISHSGRPAGTRQYNAQQYNTSQASLIYREIILFYDRSNQECKAQDFCVSRFPLVSVLGFISNPFS